VLKTVRWLAFAAVVASSGPTLAQLKSGIDHDAADPAVRIQDDAFRAVNGRWLATTEIPADRSGYGTGARIYDQTQQHLREIAEALAGGTTAVEPAARHDAKKIGDLYAGFMDEARIEALGMKPLAADLARIARIRTKSDVVAMIGALDSIGVDMPLVVQVHQDARDATKTVVDLVQGGIEMPNRDYFLVKDDARFAEVRAKYKTYVASLLTRAGRGDVDASADAVVALETAIAEAQWDAVANRDPQKTYNPMTRAQLAELAPHIDWARYFAAIELPRSVATVLVSQPSYVRGLDRLVAETPLATWKAYFTTLLVSDHSDYLDRAAVDARFAFVATAINGTPALPPRWKRGVALVEKSIGEAYGRFYVAQFFPPENKQRMDAMVANLLASMRESIDGLDWMTPETKVAAQAKLAKFKPMIGYPDHWRDYSALVIRRDDVVGNVQRAQRFEHRRQLARLGKPVDRGEWGMTPQTVDAYYNAEVNVIVFPAGLLQAPIFDVTADDATSYGAVGAIIGHEISHGFDDQGSQYDGDGNLRNWWTDEDHRRFDAKTKALVAQYDAYEPVKGYHVNGALTLGENIADNSGLAIAFKAYRLSLGGRPAPVIDGLTGEQRFFIGYAQAWRQKARDGALVARLKSDPHAPGEFRANGALVNQPGFAEAFDVKPGDGMYRSADQRVLIW